MESECDYRLVSIDNSGKRALRIAGPYEARCEIVPKIFPEWSRKIRREPFGEERIYRFSTFIESIQAPLAAMELTDNTIVAQWHSSPDFLPSKEEGRGPPLALRIHDGQWGITYGYDTDFVSEPGYLANNWHWIGAVEKERWTDWEFRVVWESGAGGYTRVYQDGRLIMSRDGPNAFNDLRGVYLKLGLYHSYVDTVILLDSIYIADGQRE